MWGRVWIDRTVGGNRYGALWAGARVAFEELLAPNAICIGVDLLCIIAD